MLTPCSIIENHRQDIIAYEDYRVIDKLRDDFVKEKPDFWNEFIGLPLNDATKAALRHKLVNEVTRFIETKKTKIPIPSFWNNEIHEASRLKLLDHFVDKFHIVAANGIKERSFDDYEEDKYNKFDLSEYYIIEKAEQPVWVKRRQIKNNLLIKVISRIDPIKRNASPAELKAQDTLRDMLTEKEWRRYATNGFLVVKGFKGYYYQIFKDQRRINVYKGGKLVNKICIHTVDNLPPTDHVINMKLLIQLNEDLVWHNGNAYSLTA